MPPELAQARAGLDRYRDVVNAVHDGYFSSVGCVEYPEGGSEGSMPYQARGMGVHFLNFQNISPVLDPTRPQDLIYEPAGDSLRLAAAEWFLPVEVPRIRTWSARSRPPHSRKQHRGSCRTAIDGRPRRFTKPARFPDNVASDTIPSRQPDVRRGTVASSDLKLRIVKVGHTVAWAFFASAIVLIPVAAWREEWRATSVLIGIVSVECLVLVVNRMRCPLTPLAARYTVDRADNFDIYLPLWLARYNKQIFGTLFVAGIVFSIMRRIR